jgi:RNA polymerase sigma factor (sigma-70 family)
MDLSGYYDQICKQPLLSKEEEQKLLDIYFGDAYSEKQKKKARDILISANLRFVFKKAKIMANGDPCLFEELIGAGNEGLIVGLDKFDNKAGVRFLTYAGWWVLQRQLKEMSKMRLVQLPIWKQQLSKRIMSAQEMANHPLSLDELKVIFPEVKEKDLIELSQTRYLTFYFDDLIDEESAAENSFSVDSIGEEVNIEDIIDGLFEQQDVIKLLSFLDEDQKTVIKMMYGLHDGKERSSSFIAEYMDISREEVRKIKKESLKRLQQEALRSLTPPK